MNWRRCGERALAAEALRVYDVWATSTANPTWLALSSRCHALLAASDGEAEERFTEALGLPLIGDSEFARAPYRAALRPGTAAAP